MASPPFEVVNWGIVGGRDVAVGLSEELLALTWRHSLSQVRTRSMNWLSSVGTSLFLVRESLQMMSLCRARRRWAIRAPLSHSVSFAIACHSGRNTARDLWPCFMSKILSCAVALASISPNADLRISLMALTLSNRTTPSLIL